MGEIKPVKNEKIKLWNKNFFLLWQGQLVSVLGDVIYMLALEFWILDITGSTGLMGLLSTLTMLPRVILGPFAGVFVDRWNKKKIIVITDFVRGIFVTFVGVAAIMGFIKVWMVFVVGVISGICAAFFNPTAMAIKPEIVHESKLVQANSATSLAQSGMSMVGSAIGGVLYVTIGAPYLFLFNGLSYLFSAITEMFMRIPHIVNKESKVTFKEDFKEGFKFMWKFKTLRNIFACACMLNFCFCGAMILFKVYCKEVEFLGIERFGYLMTLYSVGAILASILLSVFKIKKENKFKVYLISLLFFSANAFLIPLAGSYIMMVVIMFFMAFFMVVFNNLFDSAMILVIPANKRGKVSAIAGTLSMGLAPLGTLIGGVLGEFMSAGYAMAILFTIGCVFTIGCGLIKGSKKMIEYEGEECSIEELIIQTNNMH
ncbi:MFS transporter [Clostridium sp. CTA-19]